MCSKNLGDSYSFSDSIWKSIVGVRTHSTLERAMFTITIAVGVLAENGTEALERYAHGVLPLLEQVGAKILGCQGKEMLVGADLLYLVSVMEFPSVNAMKQFLSSSDYIAMVMH
jgi:uncharacterized protein (DUF1330 family)